VLCHLMQTLHEEGMTHQALRAYEEFAKSLKKAGLEPAEMTTALYRRLKRAPRLLALSQPARQSAQQAEWVPPTAAVEEAGGRSALGGEGMPVQQSESAFPGDSHDPSAENVDRLLSSADQQKISSPLWNVPHYRNPFFTGREDVLMHLHDVLNRKASERGLAPLALCGLGGIGKTQCVLEYAYRYAHEYQAVFWIKADTRENLLADFLAIASLLQLPEQSAEDRAVTVAAVQRWFQSQERWLLILDNVEDLTLVREFLPSGLQGHVLFTTRMQALGGLAYSVQVEEMDQETGALFLLRRAGLCPPDMSRINTKTAGARIAQALVQELGGLPLALDQAGAYIEETASDLQTYLDCYHSSRQALLERRGGMTTDHPECVATTWTLAFTRIENSDPLAASLLHLCAFLDPDAIPEELLYAGLQQLTSSSGEIDLLGFNEAVGALLRFSLARRNGETRTLTLHRLVQAMIQDMMNPSQHIQYATPVIQALLLLFPHKIEVDNWPQCQRFLPHVHILIAHPEWYSRAPTQIATLCNQAGYYLREQALYQEAEALYQKGLALREYCFGASHPDTAQICYNLGRLYFDTGQYALSIQLHQRALAIREQVLAPDDLHIALSLNSLAFAYYIQEIALDEIEPLFLRALSIYEQAIGRDHPMTSHCLSNLALFYASQDRFLEAEQLLLEVQAIREQHLPPIHLDTARSLQNLAWLYIYQKKKDHYKEAKKLLERSLAIRRTLLGTFHPQVAISLHHLAWLLEAEKNLRRQSFFAELSSRSQSRKHDE
jgi:tetratricopeptide (TPR) repeat protein